MADLNKLTLKGALDGLAAKAFSAEELAYLHGDANRGYVREFCERFKRDPVGFHGLQSRRKGSFVRLPVGNEWVTVMYLGTQSLENGAPRPTSLSNVKYVAR